MRIVRIMRGSKTEGRNPGRLTTLMGGLLHCTVGLLNFDVYVFHSTPPLSCASIHSRLFCFATRCDGSDEKKCACRGHTTSQKPNGTRSQRAPPDFVILARWGSLSCPPICRFNRVASRLRGVIVANADLSGVLLMMVCFACEMQREKNR